MNRYAITFDRNKPGSGDRLFLISLFQLSLYRKGLKMKYVCSVCGHVYDPELGEPALDIAPGTAFEDLPDDFRCPTCGMGKDSFVPVS
jgi:rubredoxin